MAKKEIYRLTEKELAEMINESVRRVLNEAQDGFMGISFGIQKGRRNQEAVQKYAAEVENIYNQVLAISNEITRRSEILAATNPNLNEGWGGNTLKGFLKVGKNILKPSAKAAKVAQKFIFGGGIASLISSCTGFQQKVTTEISNMKNHGMPTVEDVSAIYGSLAEWMRGLCAVLMEQPAILGADSIGNVSVNNPVFKSLTKGPNYSMDNNSNFSLSDAFWMAFSFGNVFLGWIGLAYDALDLIGSFVATKSTNDEEALKIVEKERGYLLTAINQVNDVLARSKSGVAKYAPR